MQEQLINVSGIEKTHTRTKNILPDTGNAKRKRQNKIAPRAQKMSKAIVISADSARIIAAAVRPQIKAYTQY